MENWQRDGAVYSAGTAELKQEIGHSRYFGRKSDGPVGSGSQWAARGRHDDLKRLDNVDVHLVAGVPDIGSPPRHWRVGLRGACWAKAGAWARVEGEGRGRGRERAWGGAGQAHATQQALHEVGRLDDVSQGIGLGAGNDAAVDHLTEQLGNDIIVALDLACQQRRTQEVF